MMWNHDIASAPKDRQILMRTTRSNQVFVTNWLEPTKHTPNGRFNGFSENAKTMLAWCEIPAFENSQTDAATSCPGIAILGRPEIENRSDQEASNSDASGEVQDEITIHLPTNFILDDVGSGA